jgi:hypothetical protein
LARPSAAGPGLVAFMAALAAVGAMSIWFIARANAFVLLASEPRLRGQMMGIWSMALPGMSPLTGLAMGAAADAWGPRAALAGVGGAAVLAATAGWRTLRPPRRRISVDPVFTLSQGTPTACCPER